MVEISSKRNEMKRFFNMAQKQSEYKLSNATIQTRTDFLCKHKIHSHSQQSFMLLARTI